jgi:hypothetical protein
MPKGLRRTFARADALGTFPDQAAAAADAAAAAASASDASDSADAADASATAAAASAAAFTPAANQAASVEVTNPTVAEFNALLAKLKAAGLMVDDA